MKESNMDKKEEIVIEINNKNLHKTERKKARIGNNNRKKNEKKKEKKKLSKKQKLLIVGIIIAVIITFIGIVFGVYIYKANGNITEAVLNVATDVLGDKDPIFVLVLGISEDISPKLTDTIILAGYNPDTQKAFMLSIPRDTFIGKNEETAGGFDKINALYQKDVQKTIDAVEKLTGVNINHYVVVKNTALPAIVNAIGEVEFDVPIDMNYDDPTQDLHIHLEKGLQKIDGDKAEQLLRFRHNNNGTSYPPSYGDNDYGRMRTQREFIKAVATQLISWQSVSNLKQIASAVFDNLETDMNLTQMIGYIPYALKFDTSSIRMEQLPGASQMLNKLSFYKASSTQTRKLMDELILSLEMSEAENKKYYTKPINKSTASSNSNKTDDNEVSNDNADTPHTHEYIVDVDKSTCTSAGEIIEVCKVCGKTKKSTKPAKGHTLGSWITITKPTATSDGEEYRKCTVCGTTEKRTIPSNQQTEHVHQYTKELSRTNPTCGTNGKVEKQCSCGDKKLDVLLATGKHVYGENGICGVCNGKNPNLTPPTTPVEPDPKPEEKPEEKPDPKPEEKPDPKPEEKPDPTVPDGTPGENSGQ